MERTISQLDEIPLNDDLAAVVSEAPVRGEKDVAVADGEAGANAEKEQGGAPPGYFFAGLALTLVFSCFALFALCINGKLQRCDKRRRLYLYGVYLACVLQAILFIVLCAVYIARKQPYM